MRVAALDDSNNKWKNMESREVQSDINEFNAHWNIFKFIC